MASKMAQYSPRCLKMAPKMLQEAPLPSQDGSEDDPEAPNGQRNRSVQISNANLPPPPPSPSSSSSSSSSFYFRSCPASFEVAVGPEAVLCSPGRSSEFTAAIPQSPRPRARVLQQVTRATSFGSVATSRMAAMSSELRHD